MATCRARTCSTGRSTPPRWPWYTKAEDKLGVTRTGDPRACRATTTTSCSRKAPRRSATKRCTPGAWRSTPTERRPNDACQQTGFCFQGCKWGAKWSAAYTDIPEGEATGNLEVRERAHVARILHDDERQGHRREYFDDGRQPADAEGAVVCVAGNSFESPRLLLNSASSMFPDGLANSSGQVGRNYMRHMTGSVYAVFDKPVRMWRGTTMAGIIQDEAATIRAAASSAATSWKRCRWACRSWRPSSIRGLGPRVHLRARPTRTWPACGSWARTCRRRPTASRSTTTSRTSGACRWRTCISTITPTTSRCATMPTSRAGGL
jgi:hypothetical protein